MAIHCGVDMVEIERMKDSIEKYGESFLRKIFTSGEIQYCENRKGGKYESYAARFAAKEAVSKALGTGIAQGVCLTCIEMVVGDGGKPNVVLHGDTLQRYLKMGGISMDVSLTHTREHATAFAVMLTREDGECIYER